MSIVKVNNEADFKKHVLESKVPVIVDFYADWCPPCRNLGKVFESIIEESNGWKVAKLDCDEAGNANLAEQHGVQGIPAVYFYHEGKLDKNYSFSGFNQAALQKMVDHAASLIK